MFLGWLKKWRAKPRWQRDPDDSCMEPPDARDILLQTEGNIYDRLFHRHHCSNGN